MLLGKSPICWESKKKEFISKSSAESEYKAMSCAASEITWLVHLLKELGIPCMKPVTLHFNKESHVLKIIVRFILLKILCNMNEQIIL